MTEKNIYNSLLRANFDQFLHRAFLHLHPGKEFMQNWHMKAIGYELERVRKGEVKRLIVNMPPRSLKSMITSVILPAFLLGHDPRLKIFGISYAGELSEKHASDFRSIVESSWYKEAFPAMRIERAANSDVYTTAKGFRRATSVQAALTGLGGDIFIIDDPQKPIDTILDAPRDKLNQWFSNTLRSRLDNKETGVIIVVMQRIHLNDLTGYLTEKSNDWTVLSLSAIAEQDELVPIGSDQYHSRREGEALHPAYESLATLKAMQHEVGTEIFSAQYQQSPIPPGGSIIRREWLKYYDDNPSRSERSRIIQSWDTAAKAGIKNDWSVCTTWQIEGKHFYLLNVKRGRYDYPTLRNMAIALADAYKPEAILVEDATTGISLVQELKQMGNYNVRAIKIEHDKLGRLYVHQAKFEAGLVHFPSEATWLRELETELLTFPQAKYDDQVDSISQALAYKAEYDSTMAWAEHLVGLLPDYAKIGWMYR